jgi:demethylmenaquinone methyltransferase/2-methoxy-6-polyprenyl-1,4-benzoquinol methylase
VRISAGEVLPQKEEKATFVRSVFAQIARRYDLLNALISFGQDSRWRKMVARRLPLPSGAAVLDLGAGTGALSAAVLNAHPSARVVASDITWEMLYVGMRGWKGKRPVRWVNNDALALPFPEESFDAVVSGFLLRNVVDIDEALKEQMRVLRAGGFFVTLDTTRPTRNLFSPLARLHMRIIVPFLGRLFAQNETAYRYLQASTEAFLTAEELAASLRSAGFRNVGFKRLMFGTIAIHWGTKPL